MLGTRLKVRSWKTKDRSVKPKAISWGQMPKARSKTFKAKQFKLQDPVNIYLLESKNQKQLIVRQKLETKSQELEVRNKTLEAKNEIQKPKAKSLTPEVGNQKP